MAGIQLKVSPEVLKQKAGEVSDEITNLTAGWRELSRTVRSSRTYWQGDASNLHWHAFQENKNEVEAILKRLRDHPKNLQIMAGVYDQAEREADQLSSGLPGDVIA
jgi:WXG100 family type VII secretion target